MVQCDNIAVVSITVISTCKHPTLKGLVDALLIISICFTHYTLHKDTTPILEPLVELLIPDWTSRYLWNRMD